jgi:hypothetical protein
MDYACFIIASEGKFSQGQYVADENLQLKVFSSQWLRSFRVLASSPA